MIQIHPDNASRLRRVQQTPASDVYVYVRMCVCVHTESAAWLADVP